MKIFHPPYLVLLILILILSTSCSQQESHILTSPDGMQEVIFELDSGIPYYTLISYGDTVIIKSELGFGRKGQFSLTDHTRDQFDEEWQPVYGNFSTIRNNYEQLKLSLKDSSGLLVNYYIRAFNDGVGFRYEFPDQQLDTISLIDRTFYTFRENHVIWYKEQHYGWDQPESIKINDQNVYGVPVTIKINDDLYASVREAALKNCSRMLLARTEKNTLQSRVDEEYVSLPFVTPWRTITVVKHPGDLFESNLVLNLNDPPESDFSWVKPGKSFWDYRVRGGTIGGHTYCGDDLTTECCKHYIDKAAENDINYFTIDAGWYGYEHDRESNPVTDAPGIDIQEVIDYGKRKGVGVWLYINDIAFRNYDTDMILSTYHKWGAAGIKHGFLQGHGVEKVVHAQQVLDKCAKYKLLYVQHEGFNPTGIQRTYPNYCGVEVGYTQMDAKIREQITYLPEEILAEKRKVPANRFAASKIVPPSYHTIQPFTVLLSGPKDFTPGIFDCNDAHLQGRPHFNSPIPSTINNQMALCNLYQGGVLHLMDAPESYEQYPELFDFVKNLPHACDETVVPMAEIGDYFVIARRKGDSWFISGITDENARDLDLNLDFLGDGQYSGKYYSDHRESSYLGEKESFHVDALTGIRSSVSVKLKMVPGGGVNLWLTRE